MISKYLILAVIMLLLSLLCLNGCSESVTEVDDYEAEPVLFAYIKGCEVYEEIYLQVVEKAFEKKFYYGDNGLSDAEICIYPTIIKDNPVSDTTGKARYFQDNPDYNGGYLPILMNSEFDTIKCRSTYKIEVKLSGSDKIDLWAETTVPDTFTLFTNYASLNNSFNLEPDDVFNMPDSLTFNQVNDEINFQWTKAWENASYETRTGGYELVSKCLIDPEDLVPLDPDVEMEDIEFEDRDVYAWELCPNYQLNYIVFWDELLWVGPYKIVIAACSLEYFNYLFSQNEKHLVSNVQGGGGCFGATVNYTTFINMKRP